MVSGAKVNWVNEDDEHKTALHQSVLGVGLTLVIFLKVYCPVRVHAQCRLIANPGMCEMQLIPGSSRWVLRQGILPSQSLITKLIFFYEMDPDHL